MTTPAGTLIVRPGEADSEGLRVVCAPGVGWWSEHPVAGSWVGPGSRVGVLRRLNATYALCLAEEVRGGVVERAPRQRRLAVGFGDPLFHVRELGREAQRSATAEDEAERRGPGGLAAGAHAVVAPTDGVFYRRASPDSPPFVEVGSRVREGQAIGLVEVMKTFNQILYGGPGLPEEAEVIEIGVEDSEEVNAGQILLVVR